MKPHLSDLFSENIFKDFTLTANDGSAFAAHKSVLIVRSPYFLNLFMSKEIQQPFQRFENVGKKTTENE